MKILFAGPSLAGAEIDTAAGDQTNNIVQRGPARQGDLARGVLDGATAIGLVDGQFESVAAVWHKEILFALSEGVQVLGAASMGALRAAECAPFGMIGIGIIYQYYAGGALDDDAAVAQLHAPADFGYAPLTEALINVQATISHLKQLGLVTEVESAALEASATHLHFKDRTLEQVAFGLRDLGTERRNAIIGAMTKHRVDIKRRDARELVARLAAAQDARQAPPSFKLSRTDTFERMMNLVSQNPSNIPT